MLRLLMPPLHIRFSEDVTIEMTSFSLFRGIVADLVKEFAVDIRTKDTTSMDYGVETSFDF